MKAAQQATRDAEMNHPLPAGLYAGLLAQSSDGIVAVDDQQRIIFFNAGAEQMFGYTAAEVWGKSLSLLLPDRYRAAHTGHVHGFGAAHGNARSMGERQQISGRRKSGEEFPAEASIQQVQVDSGHIYAATLRDISVRRSAENALRQAVKARDDMIGIVSHDLRNPANAVKMLAQSVIAEAESLAPSVVERVRVMHQAAVQIDTLIQDLLDVTRVEGGQLTVTPHSIDIDVVVRDALAPLQPLAESRSIALESLIEPDMPLAYADPSRVMQVISNLVGNALKFSEEFGRITVTALADADAIAISVRDSGIGIPEERLPHVFDRFYSSPNQPRRQGAGLGLPISRGIVDAHGGRIWIDSAPGMGTTVHFTLPRADGHR